MPMPASRIGDMHVCPMVTPSLPPVPHVGSPILPPCVINVLIGMMPAAPIGNMAVCVGPPDVTAKGSMTVLVGKRPQVRIGDTTGHGGTVVVGCPTVIVGG
ncbi:PAAR domain-containing protein [Tropicimonas sp. TH_r6]|uniref:PAAR domain-containing protein n=1 Tax=Tropicimonas sp. TH_r6 TaxID=3082085 RepID=UPI002955D64F|nr:PAAR domain-containing protein [Tropicimonas sp. TH_r6]MDV7141954.1 PAAR domain-containing protein [Tropicimonas sp. TH_r6]